MHSPSNRLLKIISSQENVWVWSTNDVPKRLKERIQKLSWKRHHRKESSEKTWWKDDERWEAWCKKYWNFKKNKWINVRRQK
jgi:hypothetical protein